MSLPTKPLGKDGPLVPTVGLGLMGFHAFYGKPKTDEEFFPVLDRALELGETFWDTADLYGGSEEALGRYFKARPGAREKVFLASKFGAIEDLSIGRRSSRAFAFHSIEKSLQKLGVDFIDLYYVHRIDSEVPIEETAEALRDLAAQGKIRYAGLSEASAKTIERFAKIFPLHAVQVEYSPFSLEIEHNGVKSACERVGAAIVAYSPFSRGMLSYRFKSRADILKDPEDYRAHFPRFSEENFPRNIQLVDQLHALARRKGVAVGQLVLAWLVAQGTFPIPGTTRREALEENVEATKVSLGENEVEEISNLVRAADVVGHRYGDGIGGPLYADTVERKL